MQNAKINIKGANENNLKSVDVEIPHNKLTVITGISGSGKSSLAFDIIFKEGQRRYLETFSSFARQHLAKLNRPEVEHISGLRPAISVDQKTTIRNSRSTVGTLTGLYDYLRLIYARLGKSEIKNLEISRNLFSFNSPTGACPACKGLGVTDKIDSELLIDSSEKSLREGALLITTPTGYIIYSQVTMDVMDQVCNSEGFNVDIAWKDLTDKQKEIILYGSDKIKIPFGKHTLESRMKWSGITAKPREEGYYKGIISIMEEILKRDRNKNILRFAKTITCESCNGKRLSKKALSVKYNNKSISDLAALSIIELNEEVNNFKGKVAGSIKEQILKRTELLIKLGLGYLTLNRESTSLSGGEAQRIRLANQSCSNLSGILYVFDEPSIGLHEKDNIQLLRVLKNLVAIGNTVVVVEHDELTIKNSDWIIDIGPLAGKNGGEILFCGATDEFLILKIQKSLTHDYLTNKTKFPKFNKRKGKGEINVVNANKNNLNNINVDFKLNSLNVISGVSGAGKSSLIEFLLENTFKKKNNDIINSIIHIDQSPIGRTPRSNPVTYTKVFDHIREMFAKQPEANENGWKKNHFSFNVVGGRCEDCHGAGVKQIGMHFIGNIDVLCDTCYGKRFLDETLNIKIRDKSIYDILEMQIDEALLFFNDNPKIVKILSTLNQLGLGYLTLGQPATTLSGGEAQRVKLATELSKNTKGHTLYILDEPTTGLHIADIEILVEALQLLVDKSNTVICIEHHLEVIKSADHVVDIGPESGNNGGELIYQGTPENIVNCDRSYTGKAINEEYSIKKELLPIPSSNISKKDSIYFKGVTTNNLKNIDIEFPKNKITVITGVSGSGKSSLAFDTLFSEGQNRFTENLSAYARTFFANYSNADFSECNGLTPTIAISQKYIKGNPRSTVGTITEIYDYYRLLFSRAGNTYLPASAFSFNHKDGACEKCNGLGKVIVADTDRLITNPEKSLLNGALGGTKTGKFYGDPNGQFISILKAVGKHYNINYELPCNKLSETALKLAFYGTGDIIYDVKWDYKRKERKGIYEFNKNWIGFLEHVNEEYERKHADKRSEGMMNVMKEITCPKCNGNRLKNSVLNVKINNCNISELSKKSVVDNINFIDSFSNSNKTFRNICIEIIRRLKSLQNIGLPYLTVDRSSESISGREAQRLRIASLLSSEISGTTYILDEPTIGLHNRDTDKLIETITKLRDIGNTVVIVEHDEKIIKSADNIIEIGPDAGNNGGEIVFEGTINELQKSNTKTGNYLNIEKIQIGKNYSVNAKKEYISIKKANANNLKNIDVSIPINCIVAVTGVSGSGKTSLVKNVVSDSAKDKKAVLCESISGLDKFDNVFSISQKSITASITSNMATYIGLFDMIRDIFANSSQAKTNRIKRQDFSFNQKGGRCETCNGRGKIKISMDFLPDIHIVCDDCKGKRYQNIVLDCTLNNRNIYDVLEMTISDFEKYISDLPIDKKAVDQITNFVNILKDIGLEYLKLGQETGSLSGGESQRLKLAKELTNNSKGRNLYLFDEPTTGLHFEDIKKLLILFDKLIVNGHSIVVIEHNNTLINFADHIIEFGPEGGDKGGEIINAK